MSCCGSDKPSPEPEKLDEGGGCCSSGKGSFDWLLWGSLFVVGLGYTAHLFLDELISSIQLGHLCSGVYELINKMWWGLALGIVAVGLLNRVPRVWVASVLGKPGSFSGILRAIMAGLILDLCNHGILLIAMKLYERGASYGQVLAFLIASPWNSLSLTLILLSLIGWKWTVAFILLSGLVAIVTGLLVEKMVKKGLVSGNPHQVDLPDDFSLLSEVKASLKKVKLSPQLIFQILKSGLLESKMIIRWILFGTVLAAAIRAFVPETLFEGWFGPTYLGVLLTLVAATVIEVCSEGSSPVAADLVNRAGAPGNGFMFLMAGAATDYTEIAALKETTKSWKMAFILPLLTLPQTILISLLLNGLLS